MPIKILPILIVLLCVGCGNRTPAGEAHKKAPTTAENQQILNTAGNSDFQDVRTNSNIGSETVLNAHHDDILWKHDQTKPDAPQEAAVKDIKIWQFVCKQYRKLYKKMPGSFDALKNTPSGIPLINEIPRDPWGNVYLFEKNKTNIKISSRGPDGISGTEDDITGFVDIAATELEFIKIACEAYQRFNDRLPANLNVLTLSPANKPLLSEIPRDPWGNEYGYERMDSRCRIYSDGPDKKPNTHDDIVIFLDDK